MLDSAGTVLYIGKAKNLKKRVTSYFQRQLDAKTLNLVKQIHSIQVTVTRNEREALLLETNLINAQKPRYNIIFKDDKSYPYLKLSVGDSFPRLSFNRGRKRETGNKYYGPYPNARAAREALNLLQSIFRLRQCDPTFFKTRSRPCLQYQIKRCSAPCVGYIGLENYKKDVEYAQLFLEGKNRAVIDALIQKMEAASLELEFEQAGRIRDQIALLRSVQEHQIIIGEKKDIDVLGISVEGENACIHMLVIREGRMLGSRQYFPNKNAILSAEGDNDHSLLGAFILQHYVHLGDIDKAEIPKIILLPMVLKEQEAIEAVLTEKANSAIHLIKGSRGDRLRWIKMAMASASNALRSRQKLPMDLALRFQALQETLGLDLIPERLECFDVSHTLGEATVVSCVVFDSEGPVKSDYRRFNIRAKTGGDDYAALKEGLTRHYTRLKSEGRALPDILIVDGGKGQLSVGNAVLNELQVAGVVLLAVAKGPERKAGLERVYLSSNGKSIELQLNNLALLLIQQIRDEAHRFAITAHRKLRSKRRQTSTLVEVAGIGNKRRLALLQHFGGLQEIQQASVEELAKVPGIHQALAERLFEALHGS